MSIFFTHIIFAFAIFISRILQSVGERLDSYIISYIVTIRIPDPIFHHKAPRGS